MFLVGWAPPTRANALTPGQWWAKPTEPRFSHPCPLTRHSRVSATAMGWPFYFLKANAEAKLETVQAYVIQEIPVVKLYF